MLTLFCYRAPMASSPPLPRAIPELDGLRGFAALVVVVSHSANAGFLPALLGFGFGQAGVGMFFALSGFLMAHLCFDKRPDHDALTEFAVHRASRVLPLFFFVVLLSTAAFALNGHGVYKMDDPGTILRNLLLLRGSGVLWSVPVEIHFYLVFAGLWWLRARASVLYGVAVAGMLGLSLPFVMLTNGGEGGPTSLVNWLHFFLAGMLLRDLCRLGFVRPDRTAHRPIGDVVAWLVFASLAFLPPQVRVALGWPDYPNNLDPLTLVLVPLVLWLAIAGLGPFRFLSAALPRWLGRISFSLYLVHDPVIELVRDGGLAGALGDGGQFLLVLAASSAIASAAYALVELPAQTHLRRRYLGSGRGTVRPVPISA